MRLPIRNYLSTPLTIFVEPCCDEYEVEAGGEAIITPEDGFPHSIDIHPDQCIAIWNEGDADAVVDVVSEDEKNIDKALGFVRGWLYSFDAQDAAAAIEDSIKLVEVTDGYVRARAKVFMAFHDGFRISDVPVLPDSDLLAGWPGSEALAAPYAVGRRAARLNAVARRNNSYPHLGAAPFETATAKSTFDSAVAVAGRLGIGPTMEKLVADVPTRTAHQEAPTSPITHERLFDRFRDWLRRV